jgi:uncharacterized protein (TIGR00369 family)
VTNTVAYTDSEAGEIIGHMLKAVRHCQVLNIQFISASNGQLTLELPYSEHIVGNPDSGVIHGGALTTLMDTTCGFVIPISLERFSICPTLDLRIDYMTAAQPNKSVFGRSELYRVTENVIFSRGIAYQDNIDKPIAHCVATFMRLPPEVTQAKKGKS